VVRPREPAPYVYIKSNQVGLVEDGKTTVKQNINLNGELNRSDYTWSKSGKYFAFFNNHPLITPEYEGRAVYVLDVGAKQVRSVPCPHCFGMVAIDDNDAIVAQSSGTDGASAKLLRIALGADGGPMPAGLQFPAGMAVVDLVAGIGDGVLGLVDGPGSQVDRRLLVARPQGSGPALVTSDSSMFNVTARATSGSVGREQVAVDLSTSGVCGADVSIKVLNAAAGTTEATDTSDIVPPGRGGEKGLNFEAQDLWWGRDGMLYGSFYTWDCAAGFPSSSTTTTQVYKLEGNRWSKLGGSPAISRIELGAGAEAYAVPVTDPLDTQNTGTPVEGVLHDRRNGQEKELAKGVYAIAMSPR
jgi:hypothetical protein